MSKRKLSKKSKIRDLGNTLRSLTWCFTWNNYEEKDIEYICLNFCDEKRFKYVFQEERGKNGTLHLQGVFRKVNQMRFCEVKKILPKCHIEKCKSWKCAVKYCSKRDTRVGKVYTNMDIDIREALKDPLGGNELYEWQKKLYDIISKEPDDRKIYWYWSEEGNKGKSAFVKWYIINNRKTSVICSGKASDVKYMIAKREEKGTDTKVVFFDIPRTNINYVSYTGIEEVKNGVFASTKYECATIAINPPHVVIFANSEPNYNSLSKDRWIVEEII